MATLNAYASSLVDTPVCTPVSTDFHLRFWETDTKWTQALKIKHGFKSSWNISFPCSFFTSPPPLHTSLISSTLQIFCYQVSPQCPIWPEWESNKMMETGRFHLSSLATRRNPHLDGHWHMRMHHWALDSTEEIPVSNKTSKSRVYAVRKAKIALLSSSHHSWSSRALCSSLSPEERWWGWRDCLHPHLVRHWPRGLLCDSQPRNMRQSAQMGLLRTCRDNSAQKYT